jgi:hypothetical protein
MGWKRIIKCPFRQWNQKIIPICSVPQTKLQQGILDISIKTGFTDSINFNSQIIDNTTFAKQLIFDRLIILLVIIDNNLGVVWFFTKLNAEIYLMRV